MPLWLAGDPYFRRRKALQFVDSYWASGGGRALYFSKSAYDARNTAYGGTLTTAAMLTEMGVTDAGGIGLTYTNAAGNIATKTSGTVPVIEYDRGASQNLAIQSAAIDSASWSKTALTVSANAVTAPDGQTTADTLTETTANDTHVFAQAVTLTASTNYTLSLYLQYVDRQYFSVALNRASDSALWASAVFDLVNGTVTGTSSNGGGTLVASSIQRLPGGWFRCEIAGNIGANTDGFIYCATANASSGASWRGAQTFTGETKSVRAWGVQLNYGSTALPYLPTTTTARTTAGSPTRQNLFRSSTDLTNTTHWPHLPLGAAASPVVTLSAEAGPITGAIVHKIDFDCVDDSSASNRSIVYGVTDDLVVGTTYTRSLYIKAADAFNVGKTLRVNRDGHAENIVTLTAEWQRVTATAAYTSVSAGLMLETRGTVTTQTASVLVSLVSWQEGASAVEYADTSGTSVSEYPQKGLLCAPAATNLTTHSSDLTAASWTRRGTVTCTATSDSQVGAYTQVRGLTVGAVGDVYQAIAYGIGNNANYEPAFMFKRITTSGSLIFNNPNGGTGLWVIDLSLVPNGWVRIDRNHAAVAITNEFTTSGSGGGGVWLQAAAGTFDFDITLIHTESGRVAGPLIATAASTASRTATAIRPPTNWIDNTAQTTLVGFVPKTDASADAQDLLARAGTGLAVYLYAGTAGINDAGGDYAVRGTFSVAQNNRVVTQYGGASMGVSLNGSSVVSDTFDGTLGTTSGTVGIGDGVGHGAVFNGLITELKFRPSAVSDAELVAASGGLR